MKPQQTTPSETHPNITRPEWFGVICTCGLVIGWTLQNRHQSQAVVFYSNNNNLLKMEMAAVYIENACVICQVVLDINRTAKM